MTRSAAHAPTAAQVQPHAHDACLDVSDVRIVEPGPVAFSGHVELFQIALDDFTVVEGAP